MKDLEPKGENILYQTDDGLTRVECRFADESLWLTQRLMAELFQTSVPNINQHLTAIFEEGELSPDRTIKKYLIVQTEGVRRVTRQVDHYNLDAILAVGYLVRSPRGTAFRQWATARQAVTILILPQNLSAEGGTRNKAQKEIFNHGEHGLARLWRGARGRGDINPTMLNQLRINRSIKTQNQKP